MPGMSYADSVALIRAGNPAIGVFSGTLALFNL
jgi:hypothetical protein